MGTLGIMGTMGKDMTGLRAGQNGNGEILSAGEPTNRKNRIDYALFFPIIKRKLTKARNSNSGEQKSRGRLSLKSSKTSPLPSLCRAALRRRK